MTTWLVGWPIGVGKGREIFKDKFQELIKNASSISKSAENCTFESEVGLKEEGQQGHN
jgi:hypothetical protein